MIRASLILVLATLLTACGGGKSSHYADMPGDTLTVSAQLLTLVDRGDFVTAEISDPWHEGRQIGAYALVDRNKPVPDGLDQEFTVIKVPLSRSLVCSSTNSAAIAELGALDCIAAVSDGKYYNGTDAIAKLIAEGKITDIGSSMSPAPEKIVDLAPDAILVSPYENSGHGVIDNLGVPVIDFADYLEVAPLARAEWILLLGELYGCRELAKNIYSQVTADYNALADEVRTSTTLKPKILCELPQSGVWFLPGGRSYMAAMLRDAGADYAWSDDSSTGSLQLDVATVFDRASDADLWLMRNAGTPTSDAIKTNFALAPRFKAFTEGQIYNCDTAKSSFFNDIAFHPERILLDYILIFHPDIISGVETQYYKKIDQ